MLQPRHGRPTLPEARRHESGAHGECQAGHQACGHHLAAAAEPAGHDDSQPARLGFRVPGSGFRVLGQWQAVTSLGPPGEPATTRDPRPITYDTWHARRTHDSQ